MGLDRAYKACARITRCEARNFYFAFLSLPKRQRLAVYALYAFCREADDVADAAASARENSKAVLPVGATNGSQDGDDVRREGLALLRSRLAQAAAGEPENERDLALADAMEAFGVRPEDLGAVITGVEMDLDRSRYGTFDDLRDYCHHVASAVGLAVLPILNDGVPPTDAMRERAAALGLGMQWVNILRDIAEDLDRDRIYLPLEDLARFGVDEEDLAARRMIDPIRNLLAFQAERARTFLAEGRRLVPLLPRSGRACPRLLAEIYSRVLERIEATGYDVFQRRVSLPMAEKLALLFSAFWRG